LRSWFGGSWLMTFPHARAKHLACRSHRSAWRASLSTPPAAGPMDASTFKRQADPPVLVRSRPQARGAALRGADHDDSAGRRRFDRRGRAHRQTSARPPPADASRLCRMLPEDGGTTRGSPSTSPPAARSGGLRPAARRGSGATTTSVTSFGTGRSTTTSGPLPLVPWRPVQRGVRRGDRHVLAGRGDGRVHRQGRSLGGGRRRAGGELPGEPRTAVAGDGQGGARAELARARQGLPDPGPQPVLASAAKWTPPSRRSPVASRGIQSRLGRQTGGFSEPLLVLQSCGTAMTMPRRPLRSLLTPTTPPQRWRCAVMNAMAQ
jgi:hypothetical protein